MTSIETVLEIVRNIPILARVQASDLRPLPGVVSLNNQVFRVTLGEDDFFLRIASENVAPFGVRREEELASMKAAAENGIAPPLLHADASGHFVCPFLQGRHWTKDDFARPGNPQRLGRFLRALHGVTLAAGRGVSILSRIERMIDYATLHRFALPDGVDRIKEKCRARFTETGDGAHSLNHHDLWSNNFLDDGKRLWAVDWEFSGTGNGLHDLNTLLISSDYKDGMRREFLSACGRDPAWVEARLARYQYLVHAFEGSWAAVQHGLRGSSEHGYEGMAKSHFDRLAGF